METIDRGEGHIEEGIQAEEEELGSSLEAMRADLMDSVAKGHALLENLVEGAPFAVGQLRELARNPKVTMAQVEANRVLLENGLKAWEILRACLNSLIEDDDQAEAEAEGQADDDHADKEATEEAA